MIFNAIFLYFIPSLEKNKIVAIWFYHIFLKIKIAKMENIYVGVAACGIVAFIAYFLLKKSRTNTA